MTARNDSLADFARVQLPHHGLSLAIVGQAVR
jgi:hypothetical protein